MGSTFLPPNTLYTDEIEEFIFSADNLIMKKQIYTAALIGCGRIGFTLGFDRRREQPASHTKALLENRRIRIIAGCDTDRKKLEYWNIYVRKASVYTSYEDLFDFCHPDIVVVAVNETAHLETALAAIRARPRLVILEKPVALCMEDGLRIERVSKECRVPVLVNHERRFAFDYAAAREYMQSIGQVQSVNATLCSGMHVYSTADEETGAYSLLHDGTHLVDIVYFLLEGTEDCSPTDISLQHPVLTGIYTDGADKPAILNFSAHYSTAACSDITITISGRSRFFGFEVDVVGTEGRIRIGNGFAEFYRREESSLYTGFYSLIRDKSIRIPRKTGYFSNMIQNSIDFLDGKVPLKSTLQTGLSSLAVLEELKNALRRYV